MTTKERIITAALELAAQNGLGSVTMSQIADKLGIKKPSLYNHFESKEAIIEGMYHYLRDKSKEQMSIGQIDYGELVKSRSAEEVLTMSVTNYIGMTGQEELMSFYKVIYSQRSVDPVAAGIMADETKRMILATKNLFYALHAHGKLKAADIDTAALSFAMTVHAMMDYCQDCLNSGAEVPKDMIPGYIKWFCEQYGGNENE